MDRCVLVATDGEASSAGALRAGRDLAGLFGLPLEVVSVCEPSAVFGYEAVDLVAGVLQEMADAARNIRRQRVADLATAAGVGCRPLIHVEIGAPAASISRCAAARGARMVVVGRGSHSAMERMLGDETALRLMQAAHIPVLSVPNDYGELPNRAVAAVDFTTYSLDAARSAAALLRPGAELHLVHATADQSSVDLRSWRESEWLRAMREETEAKLDALVAELARSYPTLDVRAHLADGRPVQAVLRLAEDLDADLLAAGTNGYGFLGRLLMGSVATQLVRRARCMTLIAPPRGIVPVVDHSVPDTRRSRAVLAREALAGVSVRAS